MLSHLYKSMLAVNANGESVGEHYLASRKPLLTLKLKEQMQKQLKTLTNRRLLGKEYMGNVPMFQNISNFSSMALKALNSRTAV